MLLSSNYREEKEAALVLSTCGEGTETRLATTLQGLPSSLRSMGWHGRVSRTQGLISLDKHQSRV